MNPAADKMLRAMVAGIALTACATGAQAACEEGRATSGACVDTQLAASARRSAVIFAQPKISYTAYPVLPSGDSAYRYPKQLNPSHAGPAPLGPFKLGPGGKVIIIP